MKRFLSIAMAVVMITGILLSFPLSSFAYVPPYAGPSYSGGSGTENDPYLISSYEDIKSLRIFASNDRAPYSHKIYYKLTKNINK